MPTTAQAIEDILRVDASIFAQRSLILMGAGEIE
jgi:hypothetical protein